MSKKALKHLVTLAVLLSLFTGIASADLVGHWRFDEVSGTIASDSSRYGNHGTLEGDPQWVAGVLGNAFEGDGNGDYVRVPHSDSLDISAAATVAMWLYGGAPPDQPLCKGSGGGAWVASYSFRLDDAGGRQRQINFRGRVGTNADALNSATTIPDGEWTHVAITFDVSAPGDNQKIYINGQLDIESRSENPLSTNTDDLLIGADAYGTTRWHFQGMLDDVRIYNEALPGAKIPAIMKGQAEELASGPGPEGGVDDVPRHVVLNWTPGKFVVQHAVYWGTSFSDVNEAGFDEAVSVQDASTYDLGILDFGQSYYWRVDEVNGAPDNTVFKGDVWSFTVEPFSIPVDMITVTASSSHAANMGPENTINGVGLNELDQHSTEGTEMWLSGMGDATPSIQYEFDKPYKLHELWVWNSNQLIEAFVGLGAKDVTLEYSTDGVDWMTLEDARQFAQALGNASYTANTIVDLDGVLAKFVRITINAGYGMLPQHGLSEVRFYYIPTFVRAPQPADGDTTQGANVELNWRAGREAASHQVYLGTDAEDLPLVATTSASRHTANGLAYDTTYFWQVVEINEAEIPSAYAGEVWSFSTPTHGTVDGFDQYDDDCNRIFFAWDDGLGHNGGTEIEGCDVPASNGNGGGSIVGNNTAPFAERTIVAAGTQSLPFNYDNTFGQSEATLTLDGQDWTASGVQSLSLNFYGTVGNTGQLYVKINNAKVAYTDDPVNIARTEWQAWIIDLAQVGGNLQNVTSLTVGVDGANAAGMLYIDEIGLYPRTAEYLTPVDPGHASLAGHWSFDEAVGDVAADVSGNGNDGTLVGAGWDTGQTGSAMVFDGLSSYVDIPAAAWNTIEQQATVAVWMYVDSSISQNPFTMAAFQDPANGQTRVFSTHVLWGNTLYLDTGGDTGGYDRINKVAQANDYADAWIHWAFTKNAQTGEQKIYRNGVLWHSGTGMTRTMTGVTVFILGANAAATGEFWNGSMDDLRLYSQELSQEEILWLAGRTTPVVKPF